MRPKCLLILTFTTLLTMSCAQEPINSPEFTRIDLEVPFDGIVLGDTPFNVAFLSEETLLCEYAADIPDMRRSESIVYVIDIPSQSRRLIDLPFLASVKPISAQEIAVRPVVLPDGSAPTVSFIDANSLLPRAEPKIPVGGYAHRGGVDIVSLLPERPDLWFYQRATAKECVLPASKHGLKLYIDAAGAMGDRVFVCGQEDYDSEDFWKTHTQLWTLPELQKIGDYQATGDLADVTLPEVFGELFAFPLDAARWQVANLRDGKTQFVIGHESPGDDPVNDGFNPVNDGLKTVVHGGEYSTATGVVLTVEETPGCSVSLNAYDTSTGKKLRTVELEGSAPAWDIAVYITKVSDQWVLFEESADPHGQPPRGTKDYFAYRIDDFKKMNEPISIKWNGTRKPIIDKGRLVIPWKDHLLMADLSTIITFD